MCFGITAAAIGCGGSAPVPPAVVAKSSPHATPATTATSGSTTSHVDPPSSPRTPAASSSSASSASGVGGGPAKRATLHYELKGRRFPLPLVHGTIAGTATWMLVDTGANSHVVAGWFARQVGLPLKKLGDLGSDHAGRTIATFRVEHPDVALDEWGPLADGPMLATEVPPLIEQLGIGAFISPQRLVDGANDGVILDFVSDEIRAAKYDDAKKKLGTRGSALAPTGGRVCEDDASPIKGLAFVLPAKIEGRTVDLLLDTGAQRSDLLLSTPAGKALTARSVANKEQLYAASGKMTSRSVKAANVTVGEFTLTTDIDLIPGAADPFCPRDGVVSMDVLKSCVILLGKTQMTGRCH